MDLSAVFITAGISAVIQTVVIVLLYTYWIIPKIVQRVRDELMDKIQLWYDDLKTNMTAEIEKGIKNALENLKSWISGKRGNDSRQLSLAKSYLDNRLPSDPDGEDGELSDLSQDIIAQAVLSYGKPIVNAALRAIRPSFLKNDEQPSTDGW